MSFWSHLKGSDGRQSAAAEQQISDLIGLKAAMPTVEHTVMSVETQVLGLKS